MLDKSFKTTEEKEIFMAEEFRLELKYGLTSKELREYLLEITYKNSAHCYAYDRLFQSYLGSMELEKAKLIAWKMISIEDNSFTRGYLEQIENTDEIIDLVYRFGDRSKLPAHVVQEKKEEDERLLEWVESLKE